MWPLTDPDPFINSLAPDGKQAVKFDSHVFSIPTAVDDKGKAEAYAMAKYLLRERRLLGHLRPGACAEVGAGVTRSAGGPVGRQGRRAIQRDRPHGHRQPKSFIEIQTAWETAVGNALATADADVAKALKDGNVAIQAILDRP